MSYNMPSVALFIMSEKKSINVCWISGGYYARRDFIEKVKSQLTEQGDLEISVFTKDEGFEYCKSEIFQSSCFSENRLFIFNGWPMHKTTAPTFQKHFVEMCEKIPSDSVVICNNLETKSKKLLEAMSKIGKVVIYDQHIKLNQAASWFTGELEKREKNISKEDASYAVQSIGESESRQGVNIDKMMSLAMKLESFVGKRKTITNDDIVAVCTDDPAFIVWNIYNSLDKKDYRNAMEMVYKGQQSSRDAQSFANQFLSSFLWRYRAILFAVESAAAGSTTESITNELSKIVKLKRSGEKMSITYEVEKTDADKPKPVYSFGMIKGLLNGYYQTPPVACYTRKQVYLIYNAAIETQEKLRAGVTDAEATLILDALVATVCGVAEADDFDKLREINNSLYH